MDLLTMTTHARLIRIFRDLWVMATLGAAVSAPAMAETQTCSPPTVAYVQRIAQAVKRAWPSMEQAWPGAGQLYQQLQLVVADSQCAWRIDATGMQALPYSSTITQAKRDISWLHYERLTWPDGRPTVFLGVGSSVPATEITAMKQSSAVPEVFSTGSHEAFHFFIQGIFDTPIKWEGLRKKDATQRATAFPINADARVSRTGMISELLNGLGGDAKALQRARYWYVQWQRTAADEPHAVAFYDIVEGTASYVESVADALATGATFGSTTYRQRLIDQAKTQWSSPITDASTESYVLGALAGALLSQNGTSPAWQRSVEQGDTPVDRLLQHVAPSAAHEDLTLTEPLRRVIAAKNREVAHLLDPWRAHFASPDYIKIYANLSTTGSWISTGLYHVHGFPYDLTTGFTGVATWPDGRRLQAREAITASLPPPHPCGGNDGLTAFVVPRHLPPPVGGRLILATPTLDINMPYPTLSATTDYLCF